MLKDAGEIFEFFKEKETDEFSAVWERMEKDYELWDMDENSVVNAYDADVRTKTKAHPSDISIISNDHRIDSNDIDTILSSAEMQIRAKMAEEEGVTNQVEIGKGKLERLIDFAFEKADERLINILQPPLRETNSWYVTKRGWTANRVLVYKGKDGTVVFDIIPLDPIQLVYEIGEEGLLQVAYKYYKPGIALKNKYGYTDGKKYNNPVIDYWEFEGERKISNLVVTADKILKPRKVHKLRSIPISIIPVPIRPPIAGKGGESDGIRLRGYGDSIFASIRNINAVSNRFASIIANQAALLARVPTVNYKTAKGRPIENAFDVPGGVLELDMNENRIEPYPLKEVSPTVVNMFTWLNNQKSHGLMPNLPMESPPSSGTRFALALSEANKTFNPQLRALTYAYMNICRMIEEQLIDGGIKVKVSGIESNKYYEVDITPVDLKKPHKINIEFTARTSWSQQETAQLADMLLRQGVPKRWVWENVYKFQDPKLMDDLEALEVYDNSPTGVMERIADALVRVRPDMKAHQTIVGEMDRMEAETQQGASPQGAPPPAGMPGMM
uniref:Portal protein n=1 Tax=viral metagenome TaxID=1070528 RepID=A0A6M3Y6H1_9ZZZZ